MGRRIFEQMGYNLFISKVKKLCPRSLEYLAQGHTAQWQSWVRSPDPENHNQAFQQAGIAALLFPQPRRPAAPRDCAGRLVLGGVLVWSSLSCLHSGSNYTTLLLAFRLIVYEVHVAYFYSSKDSSTRHISECGHQ